MDREGQERDRRGVLCIGQLEAFDVHRLVESSHLPWKECELSLRPASGEKAEGQAGLVTEGQGHVVTQNQTSSRLRTRDLHAHMRAG